MLDVRKLKYSSTPLKVMHLTDSDLDGAGCRAISERVFDNVDKTIMHCNPRTINDAVKSFLSNRTLNEYGFVVITDLSVSEEVAELINEADRKYVDTKFLLIDHHKGALWLNKYDWAIVQVEHHKGTLASGTSLYLQWLQANALHCSGIEDTRLKVFCEMVRKFDTWEWVDKYQDKHPGMLNDMLGLMGMERFVKHITDYLATFKNAIFTEPVEFLLEIEESKKEKYLSDKEHSAVFIKDPHFGHSMVVVMADRYQSEIGEHFRDKFPGHDVTAIVDASINKISFRSIKPHIDVQQLAMKYDGNGHPKSSGGTIRNNVVLHFLQEVFENNK